MVGKLTDDSGPSCSLLASIMGESPHKSQNEALDGCMRAGKGLDIRNEQNSIMLFRRWVLFYKYFMQNLAEKYEKRLTNVDDNQIIIV